jgi:hypothetical protein
MPLAPIIVLPTTLPLRKKLERVGPPTGSATRRPSLVEMAELCRAAYRTGADAVFDHPKQKVAWKCSDPWLKNSFYAAYYTREGNGRVLAFRGTDSIRALLGGDGVDDGLIFLGNVPPTARLALQLPCKVGTGGLYLTGHSLGGALAIIAAARYNLPVVTFNAPGVMDSCLLSNALSAEGKNGFWQRLISAASCILGPKMLNIRIAGDPVSSQRTTGWQSGIFPETEWAPQCGVNPLCLHGIETCVEEMRKRTDGFEELKI